MTRLELFASGTFIRMSLRWSFSDLILRTFKGRSLLLRRELRLLGWCSALGPASAAAAGRVGVFSSIPVRDSYEGRDTLIRVLRSTSLWSG